MCRPVTYDAWNRLITSRRGYRDAAGDLQSASVVSTRAFDGLGRRVVKKVENSGDWDCTYVYYYDGQKLIETHNGSEQVIKQHLWGLQYIDELLQIAVNDDPADTGEDDCETVYFACHNANFNVLGIVDDAGELVERYEYTPYGQRLVFVNSGSNDTDTSAPVLESSRVTTTGSITQPYGLNEVGHQGLIHDKETTLIYNRARMHHPRLGRFTQRDPLGYVDGMGLYAYLQNNSFTNKDPKGLRCCAYLWIKNAFNVPQEVADLLGAKHTAIETDHNGRTTLIELSAYRDGLHPENRRVGYGPLGPVEYLHLALLLEAYGLTDRPDLVKIGRIAKKHFGRTAPDIVNLVDDWMVDNIGSGLRRFYGLYVSPGVKGRGRRVEIDLPKGKECKSLDRMIEEAKNVGKEVMSQQMILRSKIDKAINTKFGNFHVKGNIEVGIGMGLGYDFVSRNCNSFTGTVMRRAGVEIPKSVRSILGMQNDFVEWREWDKAFHQAFQSALDGALNE